GKPIRLFHGIADDWVAIGPCRTYVARLRKTGVDVTLTEYPGAYHGYDFLRLKVESAPTLLPQGQTARNCELAEGDHGVILNSKLGKPFTYNDPCVEKGPHMAYNEAAATAT